jgi:hypothetical protein
MSKLETPRKAVERFLLSLDARTAAVQAAASLLHRQEI